jgi:hypothetical protein
MREKLRSEEGREIYKKRLYTMEPTLGNMKCNCRRLMMSLRGLVKVRGEFSLMCPVHNVKKVAGVCSQVLLVSLIITADWLAWVRSDIERKS